jgi:uncharacterized protein
VFRFLIVVLMFLGFFYEAFSQAHKKVETWYDLKNQNVKESYFVLSKSPTVLDSLYLTFYQNGNLKSRGFFNKNKPEGEWTYFYENGNIKMKGEILDKASHGQWTYYYENGKVNMEGKMAKGLREGEWKFYYENGNLKNSGLYKKDLREGLWNYFYEDGAFKAQAKFESDKGTYREFYDDGIVKSEGPIASGKSNGLWKYYYENGRIKAEGHEVEGVKEGMWKYYHPTGVLHSEGIFSKGVPQGNWKYFHENGNLSSEGEQKDGNKNGYWKLYYSNGAFKAEGKFVDGDGVYKEYYESGKLKIEGNVIKDKNEGQWNYFYETGEREGACHFTAGKGYYTGYYENGKIRMEGMIENGAKTGIWKLYKEDGGISGYYKTYFEKDVPVFKPIEPDTLDLLKTDSLISYEKPKLKIPKKKSRYYTKKINEYKGFIFAMNPVGIVNSQIPFYMEYYIQERVGLEVNYTFHKDPFFRSFDNTLNEVCKIGHSAYLRNKFFQQDREFGMFYFGHELRYSTFAYSQNVVDTLYSFSIPRHLQLHEQRGEYSFVIGNKIMQNSAKDGFVFDAFVGLGLGYRIVSGENSEDMQLTRFYNQIRTGRLTVPFRLGFNLGYSF